MIPIKKRVHEDDVDISGYGPVPSKRTKRQNRSHDASPCPQTAHEGLVESEKPGFTAVRLQVGKCYIIVFVDAQTAHRAVAAPNNDYVWARVDFESLLQEVQELELQCRVEEKGKNKVVETDAVKHTILKAEPLYLTAGKEYLVICVDDKTAHKGFKMADDETAWVQQDLGDTIQDIWSLQTQNGHTSPSSAALG